MENMYSKGPQSSVIKPGTCGGTRPDSSGTKTETSAPTDPHGLGRKPPGTLK